MDTKEIFGGKVVVLGGDFRQTLPVVPKGNRIETIAACLTRSLLWPLLTILRLEENIRARLDPYFINFLLDISNGTNNSEMDDTVKIPTSMLIEVHCINFFQSSGVIGPHSLPCTIATAHRLRLSNNSSTFPGEEKEYVSFDETIDPNDQTQYEDFLHSLTPNGMPPHKLALKRLALEISLLCFAMTINKAQGQTLDIVGVYLREPVFSHGQLYVALSRARASKDARVLIRPSIDDFF
ncbi:uncharacterized protein [Rutidosis leptorrhynchoides]|uniref:uncharacterized protein n=1 Tax=Rutidosis leptorrhynchoides TaxID=125765 RepID=UPI003A99DCF7